MIVCWYSKAELKYQHSVTAIQLHLKRQHSGSQYSPVRPSSLCLIHFIHSKIMQFHLKWTGVPKLTVQLCAHSAMVGWFLHHTHCSVCLIIYTITLRIVRSKSVGYLIIDIQSMAVLNILEHQKAKQINCRDTLHNGDWGRKSPGYRSGDLLNSHHISSPPWKPSSSSWLLQYSHLTFLLTVPCSLLNLWCKTKIKKK